MNSLIEVEPVEVPRFDLSWAQFETLVDIDITPPDITMADDLKQAEVQAI